jgi:hypothetical protein
LWPTIELGLIFHSCSNHLSHLLLMHMTGISVKGKIDD